MIKGAPLEVGENTYLLIGNEETGNLYIVRTDGYRFHYMVIQTSATNVDRGEWIFLMEYKQSEYPGLAAEIIGALLGAG